MGKINLTSYLKIPSATQNISVLDSKIDQSLRSSDNVQFNTLSLTGDLVVDGTLNVKGLVTYLESDIIRFRDNIILLNADETGPGVVLNRAGFSVDRGPGQLEAYVVFQESDQSFRAGIGSNNLHKFALLEENPSDGSFLVYDAASKLLKANNTFPSVFALSNENNATSLTSNASLQVAGGAVVRKNMFLGGQLHFGTDGIYSTEFPYISSDANNDLNIYSYNDIRVTSDSVLLADNMPVYFGDKTALYTDSADQKNFYIATHSTVKTVFTSRVKFGGAIELPSSVYVSQDHLQFESELFPLSTLRLQPEDGSLSITSPTNALIRFGSQVTFSTPPTCAAMPTSSTHLVNKAYVDSTSVDVSLKLSVKCATTAPLPVPLVDSVTEGTVVDDYYLSEGTRFLVKNQIDQRQNGIYVIEGGRAERASDFFTGTNADGFVVYTTDGNVNRGHGFLVVSENSLVGTADIIFSKFSGAGLLKGGEGIEVTPESDTVAVKSDLGHVTKLGDIQQGRWEASVVDVQFGGTGRNSFSANHILFGNDQNAIATDANLQWDPIARTLHINGNINSAGTINTASYSPTITLSDLHNIDTISFETSTAFLNGDSVTVIAQISLIPLQPFVVCKFKGSIPDKSSTLSNYRDLIVFYSGYEARGDETTEPIVSLNINPLLGQKKFVAQLFSHSTQAHFINLQMNYNLG